MMTRSELSCALLILLLSGFWLLPISLSRSGQTSRYEKKSGVDKGQLADRLDSDVICREPVMGEMRDLILLEKRVDQMQKGWAYTLTTPARSSGQLACVQWQQGVIGVCLFCLVCLLGVRSAAQDYGVR